MNKEQLNLFFEFLTNPEEVYEISILDRKKIKEIATKYNLPYSESGVYVKSINDNIYNIIDDLKMIKCWFRINPKKKSYYKLLDYPVWNGTYYGVKSISNLFIDIDRVNKNNIATIEDLMKLNEFAKMILTELYDINIRKWIKIMSGNGIHIIIPLDEDILIPTPMYDSKNKIYLKDERFDKYMILTKKVFFNKLYKKFNNKKFKDLYNAEIDTACWKIINGVAIPETYNLKYKPRKRRVLSYLNENNNEGLADSLFNQLDNLDLPKYNKSKLKYSNLNDEFKLTESTLYKSKLVNILITQKLPEGMRNNYLIFQLKLLLKENNIDFNHPEVKRMFSLINKIQGENFAWNIPDDKYAFNPNVVNNYFIINRLPLLYDVYYDKVKVREIPDYILDYENYINQYIPPEYIYHFNKDTPLYMDLNTIHNVYNKSPTNLVLYGLLKGLEEKYGKEDLKIIMKYYIKPYIEK